MADTETKLYCIGCGPGDPDLLTLKAINIIKNADVVYTPTARKAQLCTVHS